MLKREQIIKNRSSGVKTYRGVPATCTLIYVYVAIMALTLTDAHGFSHIRTLIRYG